MAFRKGERVMCVGPDGKAHHGTVTKGGDKKISMAEDGGKKTWSGHPMHFSYSPLKAPKDAVEIPTWKKGARVMFESKDRGTIHGTVSKGGTGRISVMEDGGEFKWTIDGRALKVSDKGMPTDDFEDPMAEYEVRSYRKSRVCTDEGYPWECKLYHKGKLIANVNDPATGGPTNFWPVQAGNWKAIKEAETNAKEWLRHWKAIKEAETNAKEWLRRCGCPEEGMPSEVLSMWTEYAAVDKPMGMTGKQYYEQAWKDFAESLIRTRSQQEQKA